MTMYAASLDFRIPEIPAAIFSLAQDDPDLTFHLRCQELWDEVRAELLDEKFNRRAHHNTATYDQGCHGPLCTKALRDHSRRKSPSGLHLIVREERVYDPVLEYFHTVFKFRIKNYQTQILEEIAQ